VTEMDNLKAALVAAESRAKTLEQEVERLKAEGIEQVRRSFEENERMATEATATLRTENERLKVKVKNLEDSWQAQAAAWRATHATLQAREEALRECQRFMLGDGGIPHAIGKDQAEIMSKFIDAALAPAPVEAEKKPCCDGMRVHSSFHSIDCKRENPAPKPCACGHAVYKDECPGRPRYAGDEAGPAGPCYCPFSPAPKPQEKP
jgi:hypothetical protein